MQPWRTIERVDTPEGPLELRQRGERDFLITIAGRVLMTSTAHRSEETLARLACDGLAAINRPRILLGGLGMGYTLRAALDRLPRTAEIVVVDLNPRVIAWCQGPLAALTDGAAADPRVGFQVADVARTIAAAPAERYHAIVLDLYEGPRGRANRNLYGPVALERTFAALRPRGVAAIWSEDTDRAFETRFAAAGFTVERHRDGGRGGRAHVIYVGTRPDR